MSGNDLSGTDNIRYRDSRNYRKFAYSTLASFSVDKDLIINSRSGW